VDKDSPLGKSEILAVDRALGDVNQKGIGDGGQLAKLM
jgi:hypothetical protein